MDNIILNKLINIGFSFNDTSNTELGVCGSYGYYPEYFKTTHYTMVTFRYHKSLDTEYRLYIHDNLDGRFIDSPFQSGNISFVDDQLNRIFKKEILQYQRLKKLNKIF